MMNPELRRRFVNSIEYLRRMDFFNDYSNLSSEEIFDKILTGEIDYSTQWFVEKWPEEEQKKKREEGWTYGQILKKSLEERKEHMEYWMKASDSRIDLEMAFFDRKRVFVEDWEIEASDGMGISLMKKLARIARGLFNPTDIREEWERNIRIRGYDEKVRCKVFFKFRGEEHSVDFTNHGEVLITDPAVKKINELISDTGYQYYRLHNDIDYIVYAVFSNEEVEKLKERRWELSLP
ncbi:MAG: hypothetical protein QXN75_01855 [Thermoproteota archaeon]|nr:hypothetical protein [Candidatus Brockarchaeota archaeon]